MKLKSLLAGLVILTTTQFAHASAITGMTGTTGTGFPPDLSGTLDPGGTIVYDTGVPGGSPLTDPTGDVTFGVTALSKLRPFDVTFGMFDTTLIDGIGARTFSFAVTVTNMIGGAMPPDPAAVFGDEIQNIEFELVGPAVAFIPAAGGGVGGSGPEDAPFIYTNGSGNSVLRFGGVRGGGPAIAVGASRTFNFNIATVASNTPFSLRITANPEPGSIILALIVAIGFGGYYYFQRRKQSEATAVLA